MEYEQFELARGLIYVAHTRSMYVYALQIMCSLDPLLRMPLGSSDNKVIDPFESIVILHRLLEVCLLLISDENKLSTQNTINNILHILQIYDPVPYEEPTPDPITIVAWTVCIFVSAYFLIVYGAVFIATIDVEYIVNEAEYVVSGSSRSEMVIEESKQQILERFVEGDESEWTQNFEREEYEWEKELGYKRPHKTIYVTPPSRPPSIEWEPLPPRPNKWPQMPDADGT